MGAEYPFCEIAFLGILHYTLYFLVPSNHRPFDHLRKICCQLGSISLFGSPPPSSEKNPRQRIAVTVTLYLKLEKRSVAVFKYLNFSPSPRVQIVRFPLRRRSRTRSHSLVCIARGQILTYDARASGHVPRRAALVLPSSFLSYLPRLKFNYSAVSAPILQSRCFWFWSD